MILNNTNSIIYETCIDESLTFFNEKFSFNPIEMIKKVFDWIIDKINKAIKFIKSKLKKNKTEDNSSSKDNKSHALEKPFRKPRSNKTKDINIDGPIHAGSGRLALEKPFHKPRSNKTKEIPNRNRIIMKSKIGSIPVTKDFVKKCYIYSHAEEIQEEFIKYCHKITKFDSFNLELVYNIISKPSVNGNGILYTKERIFPQINQSEWKFDYSIYTTGKILFSSKNNKREVIDVYINENTDIIKLLQNFKKSIKIGKKNFDDAFKKLKNSNDIEETERKKIKSYLLKILNIIKSSSSWYISQLTKLTNFNMSNEIDKLLAKSNK